MQPKEKNFISVVVYARNVQEIIENCLIKMDQFLNSRFEAYEFIIVNDCSDDDTASVVRNIASKIIGNITMVNLAWKHSREIGMLAGVDLAIGDFIYEIDTLDMDYDISLIGLAYEKAVQGYDIVAVSPSSTTNISSKLFYKLLNKISYQNLNLNTETFRLVSRRAVNRISAMKQKIKYRKALYRYSGFGHVILEYNPINKAPYKETMSFKDKSQLAMDVLISFSNIGAQLAGIFSTLFLIVAVFMGLYAFYQYISLDTIASGWTTIMLFLSFSFTGVFFILFIMAKYMTTIMQEVQNRRLYTYKSVDRLSKK